MSIKPIRLIITHITALALLAAMPTHTTDTETAIVIFIHAVLMWWCSPPVFSSKRGVFRSIKRIASASGNGAYSVNKLQLIITATAVLTGGYLSYVLTALGHNIAATMVLINSLLLAHNMINTLSAMREYNNSLVQTEG